MEERTKSGDIATVKSTGLSVCGGEDRGEPKMTLRFCLRDSES